MSNASSLDIGRLSDDTEQGTWAWMCRVSGPVLPKDEEEELSLRSASVLAMAQGSTSPVQNLTDTI